MEAVENFREVADDPSEPCDFGTDSMKPKPQSTDAFHLFQAHFRQILDPEHALVLLADKIDWPRFDAAFADSYSEDLGAPGKAIRLMVGLHYLKYTFNESDESVVERWVENPYWQYFCGVTAFCRDMARTMR
ncbi:MAG: transposase [Phycisphaerae bacterium]|nr:transposase [Phycisphaerae bacterium]